jgi:hypothetical protein
MRLSIWMTAPFGMVIASLAILPARSQAAPPSSDGLATRRMCAIRHEQAQVLRSAGKLIEAREALLACSQQLCQTAVRADCVAWFEQVSDTIPSLVVSAKSRGKDEINVRLTVDAKPMALRLDGKPIELNPGVHIVRFDNPPFEPVEQQLLLVPGERNRVVSVTFGELAPEPKPAAEPPSKREREAATPLVSARPIPATGYVLAGVALMGAAGFAGFALWGFNERNNLESTCQPVCSASQVNETHTKFIIADVSLGVAAAAAVAAGVVYLARPSEMHPMAVPSPGGADKRATLTINASPNGARVGLGGQF